MHRSVILSTYGSMSHNCNMHSYPHIEMNWYNGISWLPWKTPMLFPLSDQTLKASICVLAVVSLLYVFLSTFTYEYFKIQFGHVRIHSHAKSTEVLFYSVYMKDACTCKPITSGQTHFTFKYPQRLGIILFVFPKTHTMAILKPWNMLTQR